MADQLITEKCRNFKKYLADNFAVSDFGEFICASTFSLEALDKMRNQPGNENATAFRLYYGCEADGRDHKLYLKLVTPIASQPMVRSIAPNVTSTMESLTTETMDMLVNDEKCPPGDPCQNDVLINNL